jgi:hypothetical protein
VIDVQYKALLAKLQHASTSSATLPSSDSHDAATFPTQSPGLPSRDRTSLPQSPSSFSSRIPSSSSYPITPSHNLSRTTSDPRTPTFSKAPGSTTTTRTTSRQPFPPSAPAPSLDFMTLRLMHSSYLALLQDGLLMSHPRCSISIKDVLDVCERFCGLVERWGGDVLPDLLLEGLGAGREGWEGNVQVGGLVGERMEIVKEVQEVSTPTFPILPRQQLTLRSCPLSLRRILTNTSPPSSDSSLPLPTPLPLLQTQTIPTLVSKRPYPLSTSATYPP